MIGPSDLSGSMGKLLEMYDDDVQAAIDTVAQKCKAADIPFGVALGCGASPELYRFWIDKGISMISLGQDVNLMVQAVGSNICNFNKAKAL